MSDIERTLTETWRDKRFENDLTRAYFDVSAVIAKARRYPCLEYIKDAYTAARKFIDDVIYSKEHLKMRSEVVKPVLKDVELILFGDPGKKEVVEKAMKYKTRLIRQRGRYELLGAPIILGLIADRVFLVKQWGYEAGLFFPRPIEKKYGRDAISEALEG